MIILFIHPHCQQCFAVVDFCVCECVRWWGVGIFRLRRTRTGDADGDMTPQCLLTLDNLHLYIMLMTVNARLLKLTLRYRGLKQCSKPFVLYTVCMWMWLCADSPTLVIDFCTVCACGSVCMPIASSVHCLV